MFIFFRLFIFFLLFLIAGCSPATKKELIIFHASTLALPFNDLVGEFKKIHPRIKVISESSGSREACYKVSQLNRRADIIAVADYLVIEDLLRPEYADWYVQFARNRMVICFSEHSRYGSEINKDNWYKILSRSEVKFGRVNPDLAPLGYRTLMLWQLADIYYKEKIGGKSIYAALYQNCPPENIRHEEVEHLPLLQSLALDYVFEYLSIARQHNLKYLSLPKEIDLSAPDLAGYYTQAKVSLSGKPVRQWFGIPNSQSHKPKGRFHTVYGSPITYAVTIPMDAPNRNLAVEFLEFLLGEGGRRIMEKRYQDALSPAIASDVSRIPSELKRFCRKQ